VNITLNKALLLLLALYGLTALCVVVGVGVHAFHLGRLEAALKFITTGMVILLCLTAAGVIFGIAIGSILELCRGFQSESDI
jgi:hypothetical protein